MWWRWTHVMYYEEKSWLLDRMVLYDGMENTYEFDKYCWDRVPWVSVGVKITQVLVQFV